MNEFELIKHFFINEQNRLCNSSTQIDVSIGDDAAVFSLKDNQQLVTSVDTLVQGVHFPDNTSADDLGFKSLAVSLSDLAAMGAEPHSFVLSLTLPEVDEVWLSDFSKGLFGLANRMGIKLIGGDTTKGPLTVTIQVNGTCESKRYLSRTGAQDGDHIFVTGAIGLGALGLYQWCEKKNGNDCSEALERFLRPEPRVEFASGLFEIGVSACVDISDGVLADLNHILTGSGLAGEVECSKFFMHQELLDSHLDIENILVGGDDYELCFTLPASKKEALTKYAAIFDFPVQEIGRVYKGSGLNVLGPGKDCAKFENLGYQHF